MSFEGDRGGFRTSQDPGAGEAWNRWRDQNFSTFPDLGAVQLPSAKLQSATLERAYLRGANLRGADLSDARLGMSDLAGASLFRANLERADLHRAHLYRSDLRGSNLQRANLHSANLSRVEGYRTNLKQATLYNVNFSNAYLKEADFSGARLSGTAFADTNLGSCVGLRRCEFIGPCSVTIKTLATSWPLPVSFLRGCGLSSTFIEFIPSLISNPLEFYSVFISYSGRDQGFASRLHADLCERGVRCWFAPEDLKIGDRIRDRIDESIHIYDKLLLVLSEHSVGSQWVEKEVETAFEKEAGITTVLYPIRVDDSVLKTKKAWAADIRRTRYVGDFTNWQDDDAYSKAFDRLLRDLKSGGTWSE